MGPSGCGDCGGHPCDCGPGGPDAYGWSGIGASKPGSSPYTLTGLGGQPNQRGPEAAGAQAARPRVPGLGGNNMPGLTINNQYSPATSQGYNFSTNSGQSQGTNQSFNQSGTRVDPLKMGMYNQLLGMNMDNYQRQLGAYNTGQSELRGNLAGVYGRLPGIEAALGAGNGMPGENGNWGVADPAARAIAQNQARNAGRITQSMTSAGLGNTTAVSNLQNQNVLQANQAYGALGADLAGRVAGVRQQAVNTHMGGAGLQSEAAWRAAQAAGMQFGNTFGNVDTSFSQGGSYGMNNSQNQGMSFGVNSSQGGSQNPYGLDSMSNLGQNPWAQAGGANGAGAGGYGWGAAGINAGPQMPAGPFGGAGGFQLPQGPADPGFNPFGGPQGGWVGPMF